MKKGNHPLKMYGKSPLKQVPDKKEDQVGAYQSPKTLRPYVGSATSVSSEDEKKPSTDKTAKKSEDEKKPGVDRPYTFKDYFGGGKNLTKTGPFSKLKAKLEDKKQERQAGNLAKYKAEKGEALNEITDKGEALNEITDKGVEENEKDYTQSMPRMEEIDESSMDLSAFNQVSDGYNRAMMRSKLYQVSNATDLQQIQQAIQPQDQMSMQPDPNDIYNVSDRNNDTLTNAAFKMFGSKKHRNQ